MLTRVPVQKTKQDWVGPGYVICFSLAQLVHVITFVYSIDWNVLKITIDATKNIESHFFQLN